MEMRAAISKHATEADITTYYTRVVEEQINVQVRALNASLGVNMLPSDEWPLDLQFFPETFETIEEAKAYLLPKCSKSWSSVCKCNRGYKDEPSWVLLNTCEGARRA